MSNANSVSTLENPFRLTVALDCRRDRFPTAPAIDYNHPPKNFKFKNNKKKGNK
jgi:hypothetical protein